MFEHRDGEWAPLSVRREERMHRLTEWESFYKPIATLIKSGVDGTYLLFVLGLQGFTLDWNDLSSPRHLSASPEGISPWCCESSAICCISVAAQMWEPLSQLTFTLLAVSFSLNAAGKVRLWERSLQDQPPPPSRTPQCLCDSTGRSRMCEPDDKKRWKKKNPHLIWFSSLAVWVSVPWP